MLLPFFYTVVVSRNIPIYLVGMMGAGKSTVGAELAARLGRAFLDTDREVERVAGRAISEIFETEGEARFRALEAEVIRAATLDTAVVALPNELHATPDTAPGGSLDVVAFVHRIAAREAQQYEQVYLSSEAIDYLLWRWQADVSRLHVDPEGVILVRRNPELYLVPLVLESVAGNGLVDAD